MSENIHNDDDLLRKMYGDFEEEPDPEVWEKLNAKLDHRDALFYRSRSVVWKRSALVLLLLLMLFAGYEYGFKNKVKAVEEISQSEEAKNAATEKPNPLNNVTTQPSLRGNKDNSNTVSPSTQNKSEDSSVRSNSIHPGKTKNENNNDNLASQEENNALVKSSGKALHKEQKIKAQPTPENDLFGSQQNQLPVTSKGNSDDGAFRLQSEQHLQQKRLAGTSNKSMITPELYLPENVFFDSNQTSQPADAEQSIAIEKQKTDLLKHTPDSNANLSAAADKKSAIRLNHLFKPHWSFSPYIAADFSGQLLDDDDRFRDPNGGNNSHDLEEREQEQFGYSIGVLSRYQFSKKLLVKTGLILSNQSTHINPQTLYALSSNQDVKFKYVTSSGYAYINPSFSQSIDVGDSIMSQTAEEHLSYLNIPLQLSYLFHAGKKLSIVPGVGVTANVLLQSKISTEVHGDDENEKSSVLIRNLKGLDRVNFSMIADAELHYKIAKKWSVMLLPSFKYAINPITKEHVVKTYPYNFGLGFGITYGL